MSILSAPSDDSTPPRKPFDLSSAESRELFGISEEQAAGLTLVQQAALEAMIEQMAMTGTSELLDKLEEADYRWPVVSIQQFLDDPYYMGGDPPVVRPWPTTRQTVERVFSPPKGMKQPSQVVLGGSLGSGKSTSAAVILMYTIYRLTCLKDPLAFYGLSAGKPITIGIYSISLDQAMDTTYGQILRWSDRISYFIKQCPRDKKTNKVIRYAGSPVQVIFGSKPEHTIGRDMFAFCVAEGEKIKTDKGDVAIQELDASQQRVLTPVGYRDFSGIACTGYRPCVTLEAGGRTVTVSIDHPVLVRVNGVLEWVRAGTLQEGDDLYLTDEANYVVSAQEVMDANKRLLSM